MRYHSKVSQIAVVALMTNACDTAQPTNTADLPRIDVPPIVNRSPLENADPGQPAFDAFAQWDCSPSDISTALTVYVATETVFTFFPPEVPHLRIHIFNAADRTLPAFNSRPVEFRPRTELAHRTFRWPAAQSVGMLQVCHYRDCKQLTDGLVSFGDVRPNHFVEGTIDIAPNGGINVRRHFKANWGPRSSGCG